MSNMTIEQLQAKLDTINDQLIPGTEIDLNLLLSSLQTLVDDVSGSFTSSDWCLYQGNGFAVRMIVSRDDEDQSHDEEPNILLLDEINRKNHAG